MGTVVIRGRKCHGMQRIGKDLSGLTALQRDGKESDAPARSGLHETERIVSEAKSNAAALVIAMLGISAYGVVMLLCMVWWLYWGFGIAPQSWPGAFVPLIVLACLRAFIRWASKDDA